MKPVIRRGQPRYIVFDHTADLGLEVYGANEKELFVNAAFALFDSMTNVSLVEAVQKRSFDIEGSDWEDLFVNFLREMLYLYNGEEFLVKHVSLEIIDSHHVAGTVTGELFDPVKHRITTEIKAVTYHFLRVEKTGQGWCGRIVCDV
jgi:SHS2 domain-containing protein